MTCLEVTYFLRGFIAYGLSIETTICTNLTVMYAQPGGKSLGHGKVPVGYARGSTKVLYEAPGARSSTPRTHPTVGVALLGSTVSS